MHLWDLPNDSLFSVMEDWWILCALAFFLDNFVRHAILLYLHAVGNT